MAQYSKSRDSKQKPQKNDDIYEVNLLAHTDGEFVTTVNPWGKQVVLVDDDTVQHTSKNRRKVSGYEIIGFNTYQYSKDALYWDESVTSGGGSVIDTYQGAVDMSVTSTAGSQVIRQTRRVVRYIPGRANEVSLAARFTSPTTGVRRRLGLFSELNGVYFEDGGDGEYYCVIRRNTAGGVVENRVARSNWNVDKLDGTGPTGIVVDFNAWQLMVIEYEWYGAGHVEFKLVIGNNAIPIHQFDSGNILTTTWMSTPFLPIRLEITNVTGAAGTHHFYHSSTSVAAEGEVGPLGIQDNANSAITGKTLITANIFYPVLSIRLRSDRLQGVTFPTGFQAITLDNTDIFYRVVLNPTLTGATTWTNVNDSFVQYNVNATAVTGGTIIAAGFINGGSQGNIIEFSKDVVLQLGRSSLGTVSDIITIELAATGSNKAGWASINWIDVR